MSDKVPIFSFMADTWFIERLSKIVSSFFFFSMDKSYLFLSTGPDTQFSNQKKVYDRPPARGVIKKGLKMPNLTYSSGYSYFLTLKQLKSICFILYLPNFSYR